jgi:hypothetical protein
MRSLLIDTNESYTFDLTGPAPGFKHLEPFCCQMHDPGAPGLRLRLSRPGAVV